MANYPNIQKTALVTGGARRVGAAIVRSLAQKGWRIAIHHNRSSAEARGLAEEVGNGSFPVRARLESPREVRRMVQDAARRLAGFDLVVNNAAIFHSTPFGRLSEKDWDRFLAVNLRAPFLVAKEAAPHMRAGGCIANIADTGGLMALQGRAWKGYLPYLISKAGLIALTRCLAVELAPRIRANCVCPGPVLLPERYDAAARRRAIDRTLLKRTASPEEIADAVLFFADHPSVTGSVLPVDSGRLLA